jgi:hypothetical protein
MTSSASNNCFLGSNLHPKKKLLDSLVPKPLRGQKLEPISARKKQMAYSRFASLNESELSKLLADKDSESTKKATKG